jgi:hypothetical protein
VKWKRFDENYFDENFYNSVKFKSKNKMAIIVSHCKAPSRRNVLINKISEHFPVDVYGRCGNLRYNQSNNSTDM